MGQGQPPRRACAGLSCPLAGKASGAAPPGPPPPPRASAPRATPEAGTRSGAPAPVPVTAQPPPPASGWTGEGGRGRAQLWAFRSLADGQLCCGGWPGWGAQQEEHSMMYCLSKMPPPALRQQQGEGLSATAPSSRKS